MNFDIMFSSLFPSSDIRTAQFFFHFMVCCDVGFWNVVIYFFYFDSFLFKIFLIFSFNCLSFALSGVFFPRILYYVLILGMRRVYIK